MTDAGGEIEAVDVAIVGGGVAGLYAAWRLQNDGRKVVLFEESDRLGGRLLSLEPPGLPGTRVELGGMRYSSSHLRLCGLIEHFKLDARLFPVAEPQNIAYLRGKRLRLQDLGNADLLPYNLLADERDPLILKSGFTAEAARRLVRAMKKKNIALADVDWRSLAAEHCFDGQRLNEISIRYVMLRHLSSEAFAFEEDSSGYDSILFTWNAADGLPWNLADFGADVTFKHLVDGFDALPRALAAAFERAGGKICLRHCLERLLELDDTSAVEATFKGRIQIHARQLILAMPRRAIEIVAQETPLLKSEPVRELLSSVTPIPLFKLAVCYDYAWWETLPEVIVTDSHGRMSPSPIRIGRSITDLPLRQCYYWARDQASGKAVVLIYDDGRNLDYWEGLREVAARRESRGTAGAGWSGYPAPPHMVAEVHRQLVEMHGVQHRSDIPEPYCAAYRDWREDPYGGGANFWNLKADSYATAERILKPASDAAVYVCGEAYSHFQGWVEGALETTDALLGRHFNLDPPVWGSTSHQSDQQ